MDRLADPYALVALGSFILLWGAVLVRATNRYRHLNRYDALLLIFAVGSVVDVCMALGVGAMTPPVAHAVMVSTSLAGLLVGVEILRVIHTGESRFRHMWTWRAITAIALVALVTVAFVGQPQGPLGTMPWQSDASRSFYWLGYGTYQIAASALTLFLVYRFARSLAPGPLRQVVLLLAVSLTVAVIYGVLLLSIAADGAVWDVGPGAVGYDFGTLSYLLMATAYVRMRMARAGSRGSDRRVLLAVEPLWRRLSVVNPAISLSGFSDFPDALRRDELSLACVRASIEIRDWMHLLARRLPGDALEAALGAAASESASDRWDLSDIATAGWIRAGLDQPAGQRRDPHSPAPAGGRDVDEDLAVLAAVAAVPDDVAARVAERLVRRAQPRQTPAPGLLTADRS